MLNMYEKKKEIRLSNIHTCNRENKRVALVY